MQLTHAFYAHTFDGMNLLDKEMFKWDLNAFNIQLKQDFLPPLL